MAGRVAADRTLGGLGFDFKWNMGWMHDTLAYMGQDPIHRHIHHQDELTFRMMYAFTENFVLPLSHDEVVHGKRLAARQDAGRPLAEVRQPAALYGYMWAHPGKKLLFMGGELGQWNEWNYDGSLHWDLLEYRSTRASSRSSAISTTRTARSGTPPGRLRVERLSLARAERRGEQRGRVRATRCEGRKAGRVRDESLAGAALRLPGWHAASGRWQELVNTDSAFYGGSGVGNLGGVEAEVRPVARPAVLRAADAAAARCGVVLP